MKDPEIMKPFHSKKSYIEAALIFLVSWQEQKFVFLTHPLYGKEFVKDGTDPPN